MRNWKTLNNLLLVLLGLTIFLLLAINLTHKRTIFQSEITNKYIGTYDVKISVPKAIWLGKTERIYVDLKQVKSNSNLNPSSQKETVNLEVDIIITGGILYPPGFHVTPLLPNQDITLDWRIDTENFNDIPGSIHVFLNPASGISSSNQTRELIFSKDFSIEIIKFLNIRFGLVQFIIISLLLILLGLFIYSNFKKKSNN